MDLEKDMLLEEWKQIPPLPGLEMAAKEFERKWEEWDEECKQTINWPDGSRIRVCDSTITYIPAGHPDPFQIT